MRAAWSDEMLRCQLPARLAGVELRPGADILVEWTAFVNRAEGMSETDDVGPHPIAERTTAMSASTTPTCCHT
jgi:hypothetical protein